MNDAITFVITGQDTRVILLYFTFPKWTGVLQPILDLRGLIYFITYKQF